VTAGNSSGRNDGSSFVLMMTKEKARELGYEPMAKWLSGADFGVDPKIMGIGPAFAIPIALKRAGLRIADMEVIECNEAFAVQNLAVIMELEKQTGEKIDVEGKWIPTAAPSLSDIRMAHRRPCLYVRHARTDPQRWALRSLQYLLRRGTRHCYGRREPTTID